MKTRTTERSANDAVKKPLPELIRGYGRDRIETAVTPESLRPPARESVTRLTFHELILKELGVKGRKRTCHGRNSWTQTRKCFLDPID